MRIRIQNQQPELPAELNDQILAKVSKLEHFYENIVDALVYLHDESNHKEVEIKLIVKNETLFVREKGESYQSALDESVETMKRQLKKYKEKTLKNI
jgi:putative sigma-54 modulation protein